MKKILVTGRDGLLSSYLIPLLLKEGYRLYACNKDMLDITDWSQVKALISTWSPDLVINTAAYTNTKKAQEEPEEAYKVNVIGVENLASICKQLDITLMHISTDFIFNSLKSHRVYDEPNPIGAYGKTKYLGEQAIKSISPKYYIIRTSWLYGKKNFNFVNKILQSKNNISITANDRGNPTYAANLAQVILELIKIGRLGTYHVSDRGNTTRYDFARQITENSVEYNPVYEPLRTCLDVSKTERVLGRELMSWEEGLERYKEELSC